MEVNNDLVVAIIKDACEKLLDCNLLPENGWTEDDINALTKVVEEDFTVNFKSR